jgi:hypothetical protein
MSITRKTAIGGLIGVIVAIGFIVAGAYAFSGGASFFGLGGATKVSGTTTKSSSSIGTGTGTLQLSMIDPPNVPGNVVDVYINYSSIQVHDANAGNQSGWYNVTASGSIDLMKIVNSSQVLGSTTLPDGTYNIVRFNITSAIVTVKNSTGGLNNYTAALPSGMVQSVITGGVNVKADSTSALLIDISPRVTYGGNQYTLVPSATAQPQAPAGTSGAVSTTTVTQSQHTVSVSTGSHTS